MQLGLFQKKDGNGVLLTGIYSQLGPNEEKWILESGTFVAPVSGWYSVLLFGGGDPGYVSVVHAGTVGGMSGPMKSALVYLTSGQEVPVIVGAGGVGSTPDNAGTQGGVTSFGDISTEGELARFQQNTSPYLSNASYWTIVRAHGSGFGGGPSGSLSQSTQALRNAACNAVGHFGGGGGSAYHPSSSKYGIGNGAPGSIYLRWRNPNKVTSSQNPSEGV